jgi:hypothetical protein
MLTTALRNAHRLVKSRVRGIRTRAIYGSTLMDNEVSRAVYGEFLPAALAEQGYTAAPKPEVVGRVLGSIQQALSLQRRGVSATKVVVALYPPFFCKQGRAIRHLILT